MYNIKLTAEQLQTIQIALGFHRSNDKDDPRNIHINDTMVSLFKQQDEQSESVEAFDKAIAAGLLSNDSEVDNYAGMYMYMGVTDGKAGFKNRMTRTYLWQDIHEQV